MDKIAWPNVVIEDYSQ